MGTFNVLSRRLGEASHYAYADADVVWERRRLALWGELRALAMGGADVLCLQELSDYWTDFQGGMAALGFGSVYQRRPSTIWTQWRGWNKEDGCGTFFKQSRFDLVSETSVFYRDFRDRVALLTLLRDRREGRHMLVANTHLYGDPDAPDERLAQVSQLMLAVEDALREAPAGTQPLLCGDFNAEPHDAVYHRLARTFASAYASYADFDAASPAATEAPFSTLSPHRVRTLDYVWSDPAALRVGAVLEVPSPDECGRFLPNSRYGSDHLPLLAFLSPPN